MYNQGDLVRIAGTFTTAAGNASDPAAVVAYYRDPAGTTTTLTYGTDAELVRDSTGVYHVDVDANQPGTWRYSFRGTGTGQAADESYFRVARSAFF